MNPSASLIIFRRRFRLLGAACAAACIAAPAAGDELDTLHFTLSDTLKYDSNVFRVPSSSGPRPGFTTKSDLINISSVGLRFDKPYAQQRLQFDITKSLTRYDVFSALNAANLNYRGAWLWRLSPRWSGTLSTSRTQAEVPFFDVGGNSKNTRTSDTRSLSLDGWLFGGWHLLAGYTQSESQTEQQLVAQPSFNSHQYEAGLRYESVAGNSVSFKQRWSPTDTVGQTLNAANLIDTNYRDMDSELLGNWKPTAHSSFSATLTRKERRNANFSQRDYSGFTGSLRYTWLPTAKLSLNAAISRNISPYVATGNVIVNSSLKVDDGFTFSPVWQLDAKTSVRLEISRTVSDYPGPVFGITGPQRHDEFRSALVGLNWTPIRNISIGVSLQHDRRLSNDPTAPFSDTTGVISASATF